MVAMGLSNIADSISQATGHGPFNPVADAGRALLEALGMSPEDAAIGWAYIELSFDLAGGTCAVAWLRGAPGKAAQSGSGGCFAEGTEVTAKEGPKAIEQIEAGDFVWASDPEIGTIALAEVTQVYVRTSDDLLVLKVAHEEIETTSEHPFWVIGKGWTRAGALVVGDLLRTLNGDELAIQGIQRREGCITVYNIHVAGSHTYFVSKKQVLVHNKPAKAPRKPSWQIRKEWEAKHGKPWPRDPATGQNLDVTHNKALADGGSNSLTNIKPKLRKVHVEEHMGRGDFKRWAKRRRRK